MTHRIAYIMSRFPHLPETFILREMNELARRGWPLSLYPLIVQQQPVTHAEAAPWIARARALPFLSVEVARASARAFRRDPRRYSALWRRVLQENRTSGAFLIRSLLLLPKAFRMAEEMAREGIAHVHVHYATHPALVAWLIHQATGIPYSVTVHAHDIFVRKEMLATKLRDASLIVAISAFNREYLAAEVGEWTRERTRVIHCGIDPEQYQPRTPLDGGIVRLEVMAVGSLQPYKGHRFLLRACAILRARGVPFRCRIIGEGEERPALERMVAEEGLAGQVELLGARPQEEVAALLPTAHCYAQPSVVTATGKMEGIPVALMEAMACNLPVVATALSGVPELVRDGETGYLAPPGDAEALAGALERIYHEPRVAARVAARGREHVLREFDLRATVDQLASCFERVVAGAGALAHA